VTTRPLALASLSGPDLARVGATAEVTHGPDYDTARRWSAALWHHPLSPAGILYKSRHDDDELCLALYDRFDDALEVIQTQRVLECAWLWPLLTRYGLGLNRNE